MVKRLETAEGEQTGRVYVDRFEFKFVHYKPVEPTVAEKTLAIMRAKKKH